MDILEIIEKAKTRANITTDYALAKAMGIDRRIISDWKKGKKHPNNQEAIQLATLAGLEEMKVIASIEFRTANTESKKEFWKSYMERNGIATCWAMSVLAAAIILTPEPAEASILQLQNYGQSQSNFLPSGLYIMRKL
jgi:transcriptional regulator with XRE-family HTH domain